MTRLVLHRLTAAGGVVLVVLVATFLLVESLPGGPGALVEDPRVPPAQQQRLRAALGLDRPAPERLLRHLVATLRFDWGVSYATGRPVVELVAEALPHTAALTAAAIAIELIGGVALGLAAARRAGCALDRWIRAGSLALWSLPSFWLGLALLLAFAVALPLFPAGGIAPAELAAEPWARRFTTALAYLALPALALGLPAAAGSARFVRAALLDQASEPFLVAVRARGLSPSRILFGHALRAAAAPIVQLTALSAAGLLSGALAIEVAFSRPGLGRMSYDALVARDYPVLVAAATAAAVAVVLASLAGDLLQATLDPRLRAEVADGNGRDG